MQLLLKRLYNGLTTFIQASSSKAIVGFSRSILAAGVLLKLLFNDPNSLISSDKLRILDLHSLKYRCNFFLAFGSHYRFEMQMLAIIILMILISGYFMKVTCLLHFWISVSLFMIRPVSIGVENIIMLLTLLLIPVCLFDERKNHWHTPSSTSQFNTSIQNIFLFFIKLQVAFIYYDSLHDKLFIREWLNGTVIYYWFTHNFFGLHPYLIELLKPMLTNIYVLLIIAWSALAFEAVLAIAFLFPRRYKLPLLKCGIIFHFIILLVHGFAFLFFVMSAALFLYLYPAQKSFSLFIHDQQQ
jgi:antimicrobial peptide system SdpB family protein